MHKLSASDPKKIGGNSNAYMLLSRIWSQARRGTLETLDRYMCAKDCMQLC